MNVGDELDLLKLVFLSFS